MLTRSCIHYGGGDFLYPIHLYLAINHMSQLQFNVPEPRVLLKVIVVIVNPNKRVGKSSDLLYSDI
jgi:hypothetical protein